MLTTVLGELMAKPDLDDGWYKLSHELDSALALADWTKAARLVLRVVFMQIYGPAKRKSAKLSSTGIARDVGKPKQWVDRGIKELVQGNALKKLDNGAYRFLKNYETWIDRSGEKRLSGQEVKWIKSTPKESLSYADGSVINPGDSGSSIQVTDKRFAVINPGDEKSSIQVTAATNPPHTPPIRTEELESIEESKSAQTAITDSQSKEPEPDAEPFAASEAPPLKGPTGQNSKQAIELEERFDKFGVMTSPGNRGWTNTTYGEWARMQCDDHDPEFIARVLDYFLRQMGQKPNARYLLTVLEGGPERFRGSSPTSPQGSISPQYPQRETIAERRRREIEKFRGMNFGEPTNG